MKEYEVHPAALLFPLMDEASFKPFKENIRVRKQQSPIVLYDGKILDGRNRFRALNELKITPEFFTLPKSEDPFEYVISHNLYRRHLDAGQRAMIANDLANMMRGQRKSNTSAEVSQADAAKKMDVSVSSVQRAKQVSERGSSVLGDAVRNGKVAVNTAVALMDAVPSKAEQAKAIRKGKVAEKIAKAAERLKAKEARDEEKSRIQAEKDIARVQKQLAKEAKADAKAKLRKETEDALNDPDKARSLCHARLNSLMDNALRGIEEYKRHAIDTKLHPSLAKQASDLWTKLRNWK